VIALAGACAGALSAAVLWRCVRREFETSEVLARENYRGHRLPVGGGVVLVLAVVVVAVGFEVWRRAGDVPRAVGLDVLGGGLLGFAVIGLFDDLVGSTSSRGFGGHLRALGRGEITSGLVKLVWGVLIGFLAVDGGVGASIRGGLLVAATANLANLFDRAPGRVVKVSVVGAVVLVVVGLDGWELTGPFVVVGAGVGLAAADLRERMMLGDTGANVLGAAIGYGLVVGLGATGEWVAFGVVAALNLVSRVIDAVAPLRWADRLGTRPERRSR
jgi:UDP-GlcNAc:undecaprenyl-phosphate GlcNAc-1-phosphate transferase